MSFGIEAWDAAGEVTAIDVRTIRIIGIVAISTTAGGSTNLSLGGIDFDGSAYLLFVPTDSPTNYYDDAVPTLSVSGTTATVTSGGIAGTAYIGVT